MLTIDEIKAAVAPICERYGVKRMTLFGSYARGEADDKSDVDLMVDKYDEKKLRGFVWGGLYGDLKDALGLEVDVLSRISTRQKFLDKIAKDEVLIYAR
ncbi:MAG: nucleotidyltransferase domain-containing protein [Selenomonadaceae bacterium]|nr:nucleotidyltransferase domain-containing protein [Selenomonadaceae bacterium]